MNVCSILFVYYVVQARRLHPNNCVISNQLTIRVQDQSCVRHTRISSLKKHIRDAGIKKVHRPNKEEFKNSYMHFGNI